MLYRVKKWFIINNSGCYLKIIITEYLVLEYRSGVKLIKIHNYLNEGATEFKHLSF